MYTALRVGKNQQWKMRTSIISHVFNCYFWGLWSVVVLVVALRVHITGLVVMRSPLM